MNSEQRVALITGAGSATGIGFACAKQLLGAGVRVMVTSTTDRIFERVADLDGSGAAGGHVADLTEEARARDLVTATVAQFGRLDIVVNNAGMTSVGHPAASAPLVETTLEQWRLSLDRDLTTAFLVTRAAVPHLVAGSWGRIVNVASLTGPVMAMRDDAPYATAKAAMVGLTRALALDLAPRGVTANAVAPGWIDTGSSNEHERRMGGATPARRSGSPDEVAAAVVFLASEGASYITGQTIVIDGGNSIMEERG
ncbi:MAG: 3-oxoacyl-[acyl-carrier protein] reductase [Actinomycetota bacterium]|nr:3-oxoacyl-[acyl-carrier protein] reductase [Actinomycetota bacterium]